MSTTTQPNRYTSTPLLGQRSSQYFLGTFRWPKVTPTQNKKINGFSPLFFKGPELTNKHTIFEF